MWSYKPKYVQSITVPADIMKDRASQYKNGTMESEKERVEFGSGSKRCHYTGAVFTSANVRHPF
jgi:hypothetical protein